MQYLISHENCICYKGCIDKREQETSSDDVKVFTEIFSKIVNTLWLSRDTHIVESLTSDPKDQLTLNLQLHWNLPQCYPVAINSELFSR